MILDSFSGFSNPLAEWTGFFLTESLKTHYWTSNLKQKAQILVLDPPMSSCALLDKSLDLSDLGSGEWGGTTLYEKLPAYKIFFSAIIMSFWGHSLQKIFILNCHYGRCVDLAVGATTGLHLKFQVSASKGAIVGPIALKE